MVTYLEPGQMEYAAAWELQRRLVAARVAGEIGDVLILLEHPHTFTQGRNGKDDHLLLDAAGLARVGAQFFHVDRGGDVTYHGPGQLVGYPILDLRKRGRDVHAYVRALEQVIIGTLADYGVVAGRIAGLSGVWVGNDKIAAIGVRVSHWVTLHGFALNLNVDLRYFDHIIPCGLMDKGVTSLDRLLGQRVDEREVRERLKCRFEQVFGCGLRRAMGDRWDDTAGRPHPSPFSHGERGRG
ncbi:MAG: lipoyl(octanoyl) transferase LipB [Chloroflexi bacterium]|nr:lipoyl(octanoyl) transferase LipB [Chloroflexota bacterium]